MRQCEICDKWLPDKQVREVVVTDHTEWWLCTECIAKEGENVIEVLPKR